MHINFNSFDLGLGGGNRCIFELANGLVSRGHKVSITHLKSAKSYEWFGSVQAEVDNLCYPSRVARFLSKYYLRSRQYRFDRDYYFQKHIPDCDVNVATWWETAYPTVCSNKGRMFYLVQHYEPWFHPEDKAYVVKSTLTYQLPMTKLCVSKWLTDKVNGVFVGNGINLEKFKPLNLNRYYDVMVMPRNNTNSLKGNYDVVTAKLRSQGLQVLEVKGSESDIVKAYNISKVFLYLSESEGFGYPPLEAMACGSAVVSTGCTEFLVDKMNAFVLPQNYTVEEALSRIKWLLENPSYRESLVDGGYKTAKDFSFDKVVNRFVDATI